ncbi:MAG: isoleucine--tRNA ligase [Clostridiales bacterium]|jgi:isoleucyl-tRNA synthetase|nr:isoleucine--tRNA ligase [Clostridiales bacterium]
MYKKVDANLNFVTRELQTIEFWKKNRIFERSVALREGGDEFSFYDGPPTANGKPHIGHIITRVIKDIIPRYKTMKGYRVLRKAGWDTHGLPVELEVEKTLGFSGKADIEKYGVEPFIKKCKESVFKYQTEWEKMTDRVGYWVDMEHPYVTYDDNYIESVWWAVKEIFDKGLIYKGHKIVPYCPRCGTALSSHEVAQGYKDVDEKSCVAAFKVAAEKNKYFLAWTTTPWTLPSNTALCVNPEFDYAEVESDGKIYILAKELINKHFADGAYKILSVKKGKELERLAYEPPFPFYPAVKSDRFYVTCGDFVTLTDGTGIVHIAPAYGEDDAAIGRKYKLPFIKAVGEDGRFGVEAGGLCGKFCKDADALIIKDLSERGLLFSEIMFGHSYPFCWRCDTPLLYYARDAWFIKMTEARERLLTNNASVNWIPPSIGEGRMANFLENVVDWGLSRERYWGTPLPLWVCPDCGRIKAVGSKSELKKLGGIKGDIELHKPYVDAVKIKCACGKDMRRTPEVIDCWFDSGAMPFAQYHYPFENKDVFDKTFPADFISEAVDQTRGWFYTLLAISTLLFDKAPFENCIVLGHVNDKNGQKMSKHKGNVVDPWSVLDVQGADAVRWYFYSASAPWLPSRFYPEAVGEVQRRFLGTLWNTYSFYVLYAEIDKFNPFGHSLKDCALSLMDRWILSKLNTLTAFVDKNLSEYRIFESARAIEEFTDGLSNWYVRRCRERFWGGGMTADKTAAFMTLFTVLSTLSSLIAPFTPFISEAVYQNIVAGLKKDAPASVHLTDFPAADGAFIDPALEDAMAVCEEAAALGRACRNAANIKNRQPLSKLMLSGGRIKGLGAEFAAILSDELNVKEIEIISSADGYADYEVKPQLKTLGKRFGAKLAAVREHLAANGKQIVSAVDRDGFYELTLDGASERLTPDDLLITVKNAEGYASQSGSDLSAVLQTRLTPELVAEGYARELVSKIQSARKENGFSVTDRVKIVYECDSELDAVIKLFADSVRSDTLADSVTAGDASGGREIDVNGKKIALRVDRV